MVFNFSHQVESSKKKKRKVDKKAMIQKQKAERQNQFSNPNPYESEENDFGIEEFEDSKKDGKREDIDEREEGDEEEEEEEEGMSKKKKMNQKQKKRLKNYQERKLREFQRKDIFKSLEETKLTEEQMKLMHSSRTLGKVETTKQKLQRALLEERAGISLVQLKKPLLVDRQINEGNPFLEMENQKQMDEEEKEKESEETPKEEVKQKRKRPKKTTEQRSTEKRAKRANLFRGGNEIEDDPSPSTSSSFTASVPPPQVLQTVSKTKETPKEETKTIEKKSDKKEEEKKKDTKEEEKKVEKEKEEKKRIPYFVNVDRTEEIQATRMKLPVVMEEQTIMEVISENDIVIICGETGSGKTTQVPQFLYEAGYSNPSSPLHPGLIGITEPRRVAAMSMAERVSNELNFPFGSQVGYQIRYDSSTVGPQTRIKFMTDGILLKEIQNDFLLSKYSAIIVDEAHERSLNTDVLIGLLSRIVPLRAELAKDGDGKKTRLKLIIMSATLRVEDFTKNRILFPVAPPVVNVDARQFPVTVHFNRRTPSDYVGEAYKKACKIHRRLPPGGILIFLTGQQEIESLCRKLRRKFPKTAPSTFSKSKSTFSSSWNEEIEENENEGEEGKGEGEGERKHSVIQEKELMFDSIDASFPHRDAEEYNEEEELGEERGMDGIERGSTSQDGNLEEEEEEEEEEDDQPETASGPLHVLPLYSVLPTKQQMKVFGGAPEGSRLVVVATNVAETSLTIPGIKYVIDTGKVKEIHYDKTSGISEFRIVWTSQASANQRSGRAGRTGPGHCYRLFSSAVYNNEFQLFSEPEILVIPIEGIVLQMKSMGIENVNEFPFPTSPDRPSIKKATQLLTNLGAIDVTSQKITPLGETLSAFPLAPRFAKMLILGKQEDCLPYLVAVVAALSVRDPILRDLPEDEEEAKDDESELKRKKMGRMRNSRAMWADLNSDLLSILKSIGAFEFAKTKEKFCEENFLHLKSMQEIRSLRIQLSNIISSIDPTIHIEVEAKLAPPTKEQQLVIRQVITAGFIDQIARLHREGPLLYYLTPHSSSSLFPGSKEEAMKVFIHPSSYLSGSHPEFCCYQNIQITSRPYMKGITSIHPAWLSTLGPNMCTFSQPLMIPPPRYNHEKDQITCLYKVHYGPYSWELPTKESTFPEGDTEEYKYFARFFLEGQIFSQMRLFESKLNTRPNTITKSSQNKAIQLIQALRNRKVNSKRKLAEIWEDEPKFLLTQILLWFDKEHHKSVTGMWPPTKDFTH